MRAKKPTQQSFAYARANVRTTIASWFDIGAAALVFYIFT
jgi:hypothetical protein